MTTFINPQTNTFNCNYPLLHERGLAPPPKEKWLKGVIKDFLPGNPDWHHYIPQRMKSFMPESPETGFDVANLKIDSYFGGVGLGYNEIQELELCEDPTDSFAGRIRKKIYTKEWQLSEEDSIRICQNHFEKLRDIRYRVNGGILLKYEWGKIILKTSHKDKYMEVIQMFESMMESMNRESMESMNIELVTIDDW